MNRIDTYINRFIQYCFTGESMKNLNKVMESSKQNYFGRVFQRENALSANRNRQV